MKPIKFPESNKELQKPQGMTNEECGALPVFNNGQQSISCWKMSWKERVRAMITGRIWLGVHFGTTQPPVWLDVKRPFLTPKEQAKQAA